MRPYVSCLTLVASPVALSSVAHAQECYEVVGWSPELADLSGGAMPTPILGEISCCDDAPAGQQWTNQDSEAGIWLLVDEDDLDEMNSYHATTPTL